jgi:hypothetical protein
MREALLASNLFQVRGKALHALIYTDHPSEVPWPGSGFSSMNDIFVLEFVRKIW